VFVFSMNGVYPAQLLYMAANTGEITKEVLEWLQGKITECFWDNPLLLQEAVKVWQCCGGQFESGVFLTRNQFDTSSLGLADPLCCGNLIVHMASSSIMNLKRIPCPPQAIVAVHNVETLIQKHASTVSFDKTSDAFLHAILRLRLDPHRLALCAKTEMPYEKISEQLTSDANEELGPIIDEPIANRVRRIKWADDAVDAELSMLAIHILVELLQIATPPVLVNSMMAFKHRDGCFAWCCLNDGEKELGFIRGDTFFLASGPRALANCLVTFLSFFCADDATFAACKDPSTAPDGLAKDLLLN